MKEYEFESKIKASDIGSGGAYVEFPFNVEKEFEGKKRVKVVCYFDNAEYRGSLVRMGTQCHIVGMTKDIQKKIGKAIGDTVRVRLYEDVEERVVNIHPALVEKFKIDEVLHGKYKKLSFTRKKEIFNLLDSAKKVETLQNRLEKIIKDIERL